MKKYVNVIVLVLVVGFLLFAAFSSTEYVINDVPYKNTLFFKITHEFPHKVIVETLQKQELEKVLILIFVPLILLSIVLSFISGIMVIMVLFRRTVHIYLDKSRIVLSYRIQRLVIEYIIDDNKNALTRLRKFQSGFAKNILINELIYLQTLFEGEKLQMVSDLYKELRLYEYSLRKTRSPILHTKIHHIRVLARMKTPHMRPLIERYITSSNKELRLETELAVLNMDQENPFHFLNNTHMTISEWHQLVIYDTIMKYSIDVPLFKQYINTNNKSVLIFCLRMIRIFQQKDATEDVLKLMKSDSFSIRQHAIRTLGELRAKEALSFLYSRFMHEEMTMGIEIIRAIGKIGSETSLDFLHEIIKNVNFRLQMEIVRAIKKIDQLNVHQHRLLSLVQEDELTANIIRHINDKRIA